MVHLYMMFGQQCSINVVKVYFSINFKTKVWMVPGKHYIMSTGLAKSAYYVCHTQMISKCIMSTLIK